MLEGQPGVLWGHPGMLGVAMQGAGMSWPQQLASV